MAYAIAQDQDDKLKFISEIYLDLDQAKAAYLDLMQRWYQEELKIVNGKLQTPQINSPKLISFDNIKTYHVPSSDELSMIQKTYSEFHMDNATNQEVQYNKALELRKTRDEKIQLIISNAFTKNQ